MFFALTDSTLTQTKQVDFFTFEIYSWDGFCTKTEIEYGLGTYKITLIKKA